MKSRLTCITAAVLLLQPLAPQYRTALPGYHYQFPRDHFNHPDFQTEWWYYTGNLKWAHDRRFGFELTFFRQAVSRDPAKVATWQVQDLYLAHLALSDLDGGKFYHAERTNRSGPGRASHYVSLTRLATSGVIDLGDKKIEVRGTSWMDHEFFTDQLEPEQTGWDWLSLQLEDYTELMLFHIRRKDGSIDPHAAGTYVDREGKTTHLRSSDFKLQPTGEKWTSPTTGAEYPIHWKIVIPKLGIELEAKTPLESQELTGKTKLA